MRSRKLVIVPFPCQSVVAMTELLERAIAQRAVGNHQIKNLTCQ